MLLGLQSRLAERDSARARARTAFSPRCGIEPWAVLPCVTASTQTTPLWATQGWFVVGSATSTAPARPSAPSLAGERQRALAARLLGGAQHDLQPGVPAPERGHALGGHDDRRDAALHVARAPPVQAVAVDLAREGVARPVGAAERDGVEVPGQAQGRRVARAPGPARDEARAALVQIEAAHLEARRLQARAGDRRRPGLVPGRVDGVDGDQLAGELDDARAHEPFMTCIVAVAAAPARLGRRRTVVPVARSAPMPVSARTYSSW